jgi:hypothetical protein
LQDEGGCKLQPSQQPPPFPILTIHSSMYFGNFCLRWSSDGSTFGSIRSTSAFESSIGNTQFMLQKPCPSRTSHHLFEKPAGDGSRSNRDPTSCVPYYFFLLNQHCHNGYN